MPAALLGIGLPLTLVAGFCRSSWRSSAISPGPRRLLLAVILAPTDAALGQAVVTLRGFRPGSARD